MDVVAKSEHNTKHGRLKDKVILITGAGGAIGREITIECARQGATVEFSDLNPENGNKTLELIKAEIHSAHAGFTKVDVAQEEEVKTWIDGVAHKHGRVDVLVNNAAIWKFGNIGAISNADWDQILSINVKGYAFCSKYSIPHMIKQNKGSIVNIASISAVIGQPDLVAYNTTKGAILQMTRCTACDYGKHNIRVNAVCPGFIDTPISRVHCDYIKINWETYVETAIKEFFIPRLGTTHDVAMAVIYLASDESTFVSGSTLTVDGGYTAK